LEHSVARCGLIRFTVRVAERTVASGSLSSTAPARAAQASDAQPDGAA
jgi:hypothetical protein